MAVTAADEERRFLCYSFRTTPGTIAMQVLTIAATVRCAVEEPSGALSPLTTVSGFDRHRAARAGYTSVMISTAHALLRTTLLLPHP